MVAVACFLIPDAAHAYGWTGGSDGYIHCYPTLQGQTPGGTASVPDALCRRYGKFAAGTDGNIHCYAVGDNGVLPSGLLSEPVWNLLCSRHVWSRGADGALHCYPADSFRYVPAGIGSVDSALCEADPHARAASHATKKNH